MSATIHLIRHGHSSLVHDGHWMRAEGVPLYEAAYNAVGIRGDSQPPAGLLQLARRATVVAASDMVRAIESARRLAPHREPVISPLLRELALEPPAWIPARLPIEVWDTFSFWQWTYRLLLRRDHAFVRRASDAADWLITHATHDASVVSITHGGFRRIIHVQLVQRGWRAERASRGHHNWSCWSYTR
jgi:broad specificity phosphatase PhoE